MNTTTKTTTFTKLRSGNWGVRVQGQTTSGEMVTVTKKNGTTSQVIIEKVIWSNDEVSLCSFSNVPTPKPSYSSSYSYDYDDYDDYNSSYGSGCMNCGQGRGRYTRTDSSGITGQVCRACNREASYTLSFA